MRHAHVAGGLAALLFTFTAPLRGELYGYVKDSTGAIVPRARVYLLKTTQPVQTVTTDSTGAFRFQDAGSGLCTVFAAAPGLSGEKLEVPCDRSEDLDLVLRPSALAETVVVKIGRASCRERV